MAMTLRSLSQFTAALRWVLPMLPPTLPVNSTRPWLAGALLVVAGVAQSAQFAVNGPAGSGEFGRGVTMLPNGNFVVTDPGFDAPGPITDVGAMYLFRPDGTLISTLRGSSAGDRVGNGGVTVLSNGSYVVRSQLWDNGAAADAGAVTFGSSNSGVSGVVSPANSLVGGTAGDQIGVSDANGLSGVIALSNGNYVVGSRFWDNGVAVNAGAVTFGSGSTGISGVVSSANSLVGSATNDALGETPFASSFLVPLSNGNYVVVSSKWDNGAIVDAGAVTFGSGTSGISGVVSPANSLVGSSTFDYVGEFVTALSNGNYVVGSSLWSNGATSDVGAVTFGSGLVGVSGVISPSNSLVGSAQGDQVGRFGITVLANGNYVVRSTDWDNGTSADVGAVTFGSGTSGISGAVSLANSLVGSTSGDRVGSSGVIALSNGNYVVRSSEWTNGTAVFAGAVTFGSGTSGISGEVSLANSLVGSTANDQVGGNFGVTALSNGNYVVRTRRWDNGAIIDAGAVTFGSGTSGISGVISSANSLVGSRAGDEVGNNGVTALSNGNYVVVSSRWDNDALVDAGAVTFGSGSNGVSGVISTANSLVGSAAGDQLGAFLANQPNGVTALSSGNYVVRSPLWDHGAISDAGAVTFGSGSTGVTGLVTAANSLVGSKAGDQVGGTTGDVLSDFGLTVLSNGNFVVRSPAWDNGSSVDVGAVTFGSGTSGVSGVVSPTNSLVGGTSGDILNGRVTALGNGNYVVRSPEWNDGSALDVGAVTLGSGISGISGMISPANSLVGNTSSDEVGDLVTALSNGNFVVRSPAWDNGLDADAGAVTLGLSGGSVVGPITNTHSVLGTVANQGASQVFRYDALRNQLVVGQPANNRIVLHRTGFATTTSIVGEAPDPSDIGQPVTFTATVSAAPNAPADGLVTFTASTGQSCIDTSPNATTATTADFSCTITFAAPGSSSIVAEYTGSIVHAYSGSQPEVHTTIAGLVFGNGFEGP